LSEICVHGIGFTNSPDTVANENLDRGKEAGPIAEGCDEALEDIERYKETHITNSKKLVMDREAQICSRRGSAIPAEPHSEHRPNFHCKDVVSAVIISEMDD
jgi:hypothetical protein